MLIGLGFLTLYSFIVFSTAAALNHQFKISWKPSILYAIFWPVWIGSVIARDIGPSILDIERKEKENVN